MEGVKQTRFHTVFRLAQENGDDDADEDVFDLIWLCNNFFFPLSFSFSLALSTFKILVGTDLVDQ